MRTEEGVKGMGRNEKCFFRKEIKVNRKKRKFLPVDKLPGRESESQIDKSKREKLVFEATVA